MDQRLRLQAELRDNASPKIRQIAKELKEVRRTPGMVEAEKWFTNFNETAAGFIKEGGGVSGVMGAIGIGGLTAAASMAKLVEQFKALGDHTFAMKRLGQETRLTISQIQKWEYVGQVFRVPVEQMDAALRTLGDQMVDFRRRRGELFGQLNQVDGGFAEKLRLEDTQHQLQDIFAWLSKIPDAAMRNRWAKEFFGTDDLNALLTNGLPALNAAIADANKNVTPITAEMQKQADIFNKSVVDFNQAWQNFETQVGPFVFDQLNKALEDFKSVFDEIKSAYDWFEKAKQDPTGTAKAAADALDKAVGDKAKEVGDRWRDRLHGQGSGGRGEDGNALHRNEEAPAGWSALRKRSAYVTFDGASPTSSDAEAMLAEGVKQGVLAAFREWATQAGVQKGGAQSGFQNASVQIIEGAPEPLGDAGGSSASAIGHHRSGGPREGVADLRGFGKAHAGKWWTPDRVSHAVERLRSEAGLTEAGAEGLVSRWANVEAGAGPTAFNPKSGAAGIGQWLGSRRRGFTADYDSQLTHAIKELNGSELRAARVLRRAQNAREAAIGATMFERAEHYNPRTGTDDWTGKTLAGIGHIHDLAEEARKAGVSATRGAADGSLEAHIHLHQDGRIKGVSGSSRGMVAPPQIHLQRGPTMTTPNITA